MRFSGIKPAVIICLVISAVYLTEQLWFEKISSHNYLPSFISGFGYAPAQSGANTDFLAMPERMVTGVGGGAYSIKYNGLQGSAAKTACDAVIDAALKNGSAGALTALDWPLILSRPGFLYQYAFNMPSDAFVLRFKQKNIALTSKIGSFTDIAVYPVDSSVSGVIFIDGAGRRAFGCQISDGQLAAQLSAALDSARRADSFLYISTSQGGSDNPGVNIFVPQSASPHSYAHLAISNPYSGPGGVLYKNIIPLIGIFFDKPSSQWANNPDNYTFSDGSNFVRYLPNDVLEYDNYSVPDTSADTAFADAYAAALAMIAADKTVANDYFLAAYDQSGASRVFSFDYAVDDFPILIPDTLASDIGLKHIIEVTVQNGRVVKYKKLAYNFNQSGKVSGANLQFRQVFESIAKQSGGGSGGITFDSVNIGYKAEKSNDIKLNWFIGVNNHMFVQGVD